MRDTILHEIAHALTDSKYAEHGKRWRAKAIEIGANGSATCQYNFDHGEMQNQHSKHVRAVNKDVNVRTAKTARSYRWTAYCAVQGCDTSAGWLRRPRWLLRSCKKHPGEIVMWSLEDNLLEWGMCRWPDEYVLINPSTERIIWSQRTHFRDI